MENLRRLQCTDRAGLARVTSDFVHEALTSHPGRFVALAVGESTLPLYRGLDADGPEWAGRAVTPVDELLPAPADPARRFSARLAAALPEGLRARLVPIDVAGDPGRRADELEARLQAEGLAAVVLGLGPDGHFAFNQPPTPFDTPARVVDLCPANLARLGPVEPARRALTFGVTTVMAAGAVLVVAAGPGKARALRRLVEGPEAAAWPVTWLRRHPRLTVVVGADLS